MEGQPAWRGGRAPGGRGLIEGAGKGTCYVVPTLLVSQVLNKA